MVSQTEYFANKILLTLISSELDIEGQLKVLRIAKEKLEENKQKRDKS